MKTKSAADIQRDIALMRLAYQERQQEQQATPDLHPWSRPLCYLASIVLSLWLILFFILWLTSSI